MWCMQFTTCSCTEPSQNGRYCAKWSCIEVDNNGLAFAEYEDYTCLRAASSGSYCMAWKGDIDGAEEFEFSTCSCSRAGVGDRFCSRWNCYEKGLQYHIPNLKISIMSILVGGLGVLASLAQKSLYFEDGSCCYHVTGFVWAAGWLVLGIYLAGLMILFITVPVWVGCWIVTDVGLAIIGDTNQRDNSLTYNIGNRLRPGCFGRAAVTTPAVKEDPATIEMPSTDPPVIEGGQEAPPQYQMAAADPSLGPPPAYNPNAPQS